MKREENIKKAEINAGMQECREKVRSWKLEDGRPEKWIEQGQFHWEEGQSLWGESISPMYAEQSPGGKGLVHETDFLTIKFGMTGENAGIQECGNAGMQRKTRNSKLKTCDAKKEYTPTGFYTPLDPLKGSTRKEVLINSGYVCWNSPLGVGGSREIKKEYSTVFHNKQLGLTPLTRFLVSEERAIRACELLLFFNN